MNPTSVLTTLSLLFCNWEHFPTMGQRNKVLETDTPTAKFLYTIIKQLDLKSVSLLSNL